MFPKQLGIEETAFKKRHDYVTIVSDQEAGTVLHVGQDRKKESFKSWYSGLSKGQKESIESVSMDMWPAFIHATLESLSNAEEKIAFDKFHVAKYLSGAVDKVLRQEKKHSWRKAVMTSKAVSTKGFIILKI